MEDEVSIIDLSAHGKNIEKNASTNNIPDVQRPASTLHPQLGEEEEELRSLNV